ncbi:hypothetical protein K32_42190 [Kaistia sp. 32K]|uniref:hypothetical protein n=1 Tax=Kaistia sp. 32K TaxID=2795690 RepID=UPI0019161A41|nr:hypothetical protein [Kaistia sp. 32K]BCP55602.1 hypothetical protein K32_42190 [Kaistia sp. 32K]
MTATTSTRFPAVSNATSNAEMLELLKAPEKAIAFAIEHIEEFEVRAFLMEWASGADLTPWVNGWKSDLEAGNGAPRR